MIKQLRILASIIFALFAIISFNAGATNFSLWINGKGGGGVVGNYNDFKYWGPSTVNAGVNKKAVNWDGYNTIASQSGKIRDALDCFCTGANWCYVATHSAGDLMMGYTMANYGGSTRHKKNASPNTAGQCGNSDGSTQTGWNIKWVRAASGAAGGSELANSGTWVVSDPIVKDLVTTTARAMYDHNNTRNIWFYMYAGAKGTLYSGILPGQDDEVVAYHSTGGVSGSGGGSYCNPTDWFCNDLTLGSAVNESGTPKWNYHYVAFRDDNEQYNHNGNGNWENIMGVVRAAMEAYAK
jgi:hypothetical protein